MSVESIIGKFDLPPPATPVGSYVPVVRSDRLVFVSGQLPLGPSGLTHAGKVGREFSVEEGNAAARQCALNLLAVLRAELGSLDRIARVVKLDGFVNAVEDFEEAASVINGASDLMVEVFGEAGKHARAAVSVGGLPKEAAVEIAGVFELG